MVRENPKEVCKSKVYKIISFYTFYKKTILKNWLIIACKFRGI